MAVTARRDADGPGGPPEGRPDPGIREALVLEAAACRLAVEDLRRDPGDGPALEMAGRVLAVLEVIAERAFAEEVSEARIAALCARAVEQDRAARARGRLRAL
jgi:hypothetical protein